MSRLNETILKLKFKKVIISYVMISVIAVIVCTISVGIVFRDSISFAWQYSKLSEDIEKADEDNIQSEVDRLASSSTNLVDVLILNTDNDVMYSARNSEFANGQFKLTKMDNREEYLTNNMDENVIFKFVRGDEFLLSSIFDHHFEKIRSDYEDESFYESNDSKQTVYMLTYLRAGNHGYKIYIISNPYTTEGGELALSVAAAVGILIFMVYWVLLALWVYQNAMKSRLRPFFWGVVVLITNIAGLFVYLMFKNGNNVCPACGASQEKSHKFCTNCGAEIGRSCEQCGTHIAKHDNYCSGCGKKLNG